MARTLIFTMALVIAAWVISGCAINIGDQEIRFRPATRIPARVLEGGDGELDHWDGWEPAGDHLFFLIRGTF